MQPFENQQKSDGNNNLTHTITNSLFISCKQLNILFIFKTICLSVPSKKKKINMFKRWQNELSLQSGSHRIHKYV